MNNLNPSIFQSCDVHQMITSLPQVRAGQSMLTGEPLLMALSSQANKLRLLLASNLLKQPIFSSFPHENSLEKGLRIFRQENVQAYSLLVNGDENLTWKTSVENLLGEKVDWKLESNSNPIVEKVNVLLNQETAVLKPSTPSIKAPGSVLEKIAQKFQNLRQKMQTQNPLATAWISSPLSKPEIPMGRWMLLALMSSGFSAICLVMALF